MAQDTAPSGPIFEARHSATSAIATRNDTFYESLSHRRDLSEDVLADADALLAVE